MQSDTKFRRARRKNAITEAPREAQPGRVIVVLLCAVIIIATLVFGGVDSWAIGFFALSAAVIVVVWVVDGLQTGELRYSSSGLQFPVAALLLLGCVQLLPLGGSPLSNELLSIDASAALSMDPYATRLFVIRLAIYAVFFAAALTFIEGTDRIRRVALILIGFGSLMAFFAILQRLADAEAIYGVRPTPDAIFFGTFVNQHHFAALMVMLSGLCGGLLLGRGLGRDKKMFAAIGIVVMGIAVFFTGSRGGLISYSGMVLFAAAATYLVQRKRSGAGVAETVKRSWLLIGGSVAFLMIILFGAFFLGGGEGLFRGLGPDTQTDITSGRTHFWSIALKIFADNPVIGAGFDAFGVAYPRYDTWNGMYRVEQAHNDYLQTLADGGVLAFVCITAFICLFLRAAVQKIKNTSRGLDRDIAIGALAGCIGILIHSFFDFPLRTPANAFVFLMLVVLVTAKGEEKIHVRRRSGRNEKQGQTT